MSFQDNLRMHREQLGITAKDFAAQLGINYGTYAGYETQGREPKYETLCKIAAALNVSIDDLLGYSTNKYEHYSALVRAVGYSLIDEREDGSIVIVNEFPGTDLSPDDVVSFPSKEDFCDYINRIIQLHNKLHDAELKRLLYMGLERKALFDEFAQPGDPLERLEKMRVIDVVANEYIDFASKKAAARAPVERDNTKKVK